MNILNHAVLKKEHEKKTIKGTVLKVPGYAYAITIISLMIVALSYYLALSAPAKEDIAITVTEHIQQKQTKDAQK